MKLLNKARFKIGKIIFYLVLMVLPSCPSRELLETDFEFYVEDVRHK